MLAGTGAAASLHDQLDTQARLEKTGWSCVDVFRMITDLDIPLLFRPLKGLLGASIREADLLGILVSTQRPLHIQRFTAAHELGHVLLKHEGSLDWEEEIVGGQKSRRDTKEVAADAFAAELLAPKWLIKNHCRRHRWTREQLQDPAVAYQLSLRLSISYQATCCALLSQEILTSTAVDQLLEHEPKDLKKKVLGAYSLGDSRADAWALAEADAGLLLEGSPNDLFAMRLIEHAAAGYLWQFDGDGENALTLHGDDRSFPPDEMVGVPVSREIVIAGALGKHEIRLREVRPWDPTDVNRVLEVGVVLFERESGLPRHLRPTADTELAQ